MTQDAWRATLALQDKLPGHDRSESRWRSIYRARLGIYCGKRLQEVSVDARESRAIPVEYAVAVDRFLDASRLSPASRRVYQISLNTWSWLLIDRTPPPGVERRNARTPVVPLARLDGPRAATRLRAARERRALTVDERTLERESAILRTALGWWAARG